MAHYYLDRVNDFIKEKITDNVRKGDIAKRSGQYVVKKLKDYEDAYKGRYIGSLKDEVHNRLLQGDQELDVGIQSIVGTKDKLHEIKEYTVGNIGRAVHSVDWNKVEKLTKTGTAREILKAGTMGATKRGLNFAKNTAITKADDKISEFRGDGSLDLGTNVMVELRDVERTAVHTAFQVKNTAEVGYKGAKFAVKYNNALKDLESARTVLANTSPINEALYNQRAAQVVLAELKIKRFHIDLKSAAKNKILAPYYNAEATARQIYHIGQISSGLVKRASGRTYRVANTGSATFERRARRPGRYREGTPRLSARARVNLKKYYWKQRELKRQKRLIIKRRIRFRRYLHAGELRIKAAYQRAYLVGQRSYQATRAGVEFGVRRGVDLGREGVRTLSKTGSKAYGAANKGARYTYNVGRTFIRTGTGTGTATKLGGRAATRLGGIALKLGFPGIAANLGVGGVAAAGVAGTGTAAVGTAAVGTGAVGTGAVVVGGVSLSTVGVVVLLIGLLLIPIIMLISMATAPYVGAVVLAEEDVFLAYRDKVQELDESFNQEVKETIDKLEEQTRFGCGPECSKEEARYNGGLNADGESQAGITIKFTDTIPRTDQAGNLIIETDWQGVLALAAIVYDQNLTYDGMIGDGEQAKEDEVDLIRQIHSELYQLTSEEYTLGCPENGDCSGCWYWTTCSWVDASGRTHYYDCEKYKACCIGHEGATVTLTIHSLDGVYHPDPNDPTKEERVVDKHLPKYELAYKWWHQLATYNIEDQYPGVRTKASENMPAPVNLPADWPIDRWGYPARWEPSYDGPPAGWKPEGWPDLSPFLVWRWRMYL